jgi:putative transcriptional regulator
MIPDPDSFEVAQERQKMKTCYNCGKPMRTIKDQPYHYIESGLPVVLHGITQYQCTECGEIFAALPNVKKLHRAIGDDICRQKKSLLVAEEIKFLRKELRLKAKELAAILGVTDSTVSRWETGKKQIGEGQDRLLRSIYLSCIAETCHPEQTCSCHLNVFRNLPAKRKPLQESQEIELNPQDWILSQAV